MEAENQEKNIKQLIIDNQQIQQKINQLKNQVIGSSSSPNYSQQQPQAQYQKQPSQVQYQQPQQQYQQPLSQVQPINVMPQQQPQQKPQQQPQGQDNQQQEGVKLNHLTDQPEMLNNYCKLINSSFELDCGHKFCMCCLQNYLLGKTEKFELDKTTRENIEIYDIKCPNDKIGGPACDHKIKAKDLERFPAF